MTNPFAYVVIGALAILVLVVGQRSKGFNPFLTAMTQILVVVAAVALVKPLGIRSVIALGVAYYGGFFMGRAFEGEKAKPKQVAPPRARRRN